MNRKQLEAKAQNLGLNFSSETSGEDLQMLVARKERDATSHPAQVEDYKLDNTVNHDHPDEKNSRPK